MEFSRDDFQSEVAGVARDTAQRFSESYWQGVDEHYNFPEEFWAATIEADLAGIAIPEKFGGSGRGLLDMSIAAEALAEHGAGMEGGAMLVGGPVFGGCLITRHGNHEQQEAYLPGIVAGEMWGGAFTEPDSGSNITTIRTRAARDGDVYRVNGQKAYISQLKHSTHVVVMARTSPYDEAQRVAGVSLLLGELPSAAVEARPLKKMGSHFMDTNMVFFDDYEVPVANLIGEEGAAWPALYDVLNPERIVLAAAAVGAGTLAIRRAVQFATERSVWGRPLASHQGLQFPLAKSQAALAAARLKVYEAAWLYDQGLECGVAAATAKYVAAHAALEAADNAIQTFGGAGYCVESGVERHYRNLRLNRLAPISDEMALNYLAQKALGMPRGY